MFWSLAPTMGSPHPLDSFISHHLPEAFQPLARVGIFIKFEFDCCIIPLLLCLSDSFLSFRYLFKLLPGSKALMNMCLS